MERTKQYVSVNATFSPDGTCEPLSVKLGDDKFSIDKVKDCRKAASTKVGGTGLRYTVSILGKETFLFYEGHGKWFVEAKYRG